MKNRIILLEQPVRMISSFINHYPLMVLIALSMLFSASSIIPGESTQKTDDLRQKKLELLEKLENGTEISSEDIRSSFGGTFTGNMGNEDIFFPTVPDFPEPFNYSFHHSGRGDVIISSEEMKEIHEKISESIGELKKAMESFRNSEEFIHFKAEFKRWSKELGKDMEKMGEELSKSSREGRSKVEVRIY